MTEGNAVRKIVIRMAGLIFYIAAGFALLFWKLRREGLHNAELLLPLAWLAGAVILGLRLDKACKQAGKRGEAAHHFFFAVIWLLLGIGFMKQDSGIRFLCGVLGVVHAVVYAVYGVRAAGEVRRNEESAKE